MFIFLFPWSFAIPAIFTIKPVAPDDQSAEDVKLLFGLAWVIALVFFSSSSAKANYYMVIVMPFAAFHLALLLESRDFLTGKANMILGGLVALVAAGAALALHFSAVPSENPLQLMGLPWRQFAVVALGCAAILSVLAALVAWRKPKVGIVAYAILPVYILVLLLNVVGAMEGFVTAARIARFIQHDMPDRPVYLYRLFEQNSSLPFYLKKSVFVIDSRSNDLYWGNKLEPLNTVMVSQGLFAAITTPVIVVVPDSYLEEFTTNRLQERFTSHRHFGKNTVFY